MQQRGKISKTIDYMSKVLKKANNKFLTWDIKRSRRQRVKNKYWN